MNPELHGSVTRADSMPLDDGVNTGNCYEQCNHTNEGEMVECVTPIDSKPVDCKHLQGLCTNKNSSFDELLSLVDIDNILLREGSVNGNHLSNQVSRSNKKSTRLMDSELHCSDTRAYPMPPLGNEVNMTNCYEQCEEFFKRHQSIHYKVLIAYWMMGGYIGNLGSDSMEEAYKKGHDILWGLVYEEGILKLSDDDEGEIVEFVTPADSKRVDCKHQIQGPCTKQDLGFDELLSLDEIDNFLLIDGMQQSSVNGNHLSRQVSRSNEVLNYLAHFNPTRKSLRHLLRKAKNLSALLLRDCGPLPPINFGHYQFPTLTALEISGINDVSSGQIFGISSLNQLQYLNFSDLDILAIPDGFFYGLLVLRRIVIRGCSRLRYLRDGPQLEQLQVIDLSHCTTLEEAFFFEHDYYEELQMIDVSYTNLGIPLSSSEIFYTSPCLTHVFLGEIKLRECGMYRINHPTIFDDSRDWTIKYLRNCSVFHVIDNLRVLDLSGASIVKSLTVGKTSDHNETAKFYLQSTRERAKISILILQGCTSLERLPRMTSLPNLELLDVSGCESLSHLPKDLGNLTKLKELNLSSCSSLRKLRSGLFDRMSCLLKLDLSATKVKHLPSFSNLTSLFKLSLRGLELDSLDTLASLSNLVELDLSGVKISFSEEFKLDFLQSLVNLETLNLSRTFVVELPDISMLVSLRELLLADCQELNALSDLKSLTNLEILDLSLKGDSTINKEEIDEDAQRGLSLSAPTSLRKLLLTNRSSVQMLFALTSLDKLEFVDLHGTDVTVTDEGVLSRMRNPQGGHLQQTITKPAEIHIVSVSEKSSHQPSGFHDNPDGVSKLDTLISSIQKNFESAMSISNNSDNDIAATTTNNQYFKRRLGMLQSDWKYVIANIDSLKSSLSSEDLFEELMDVAACLSAADLSVDSTNFKQLFRIVVRLKLMVPQKQVDKIDTTGIRKKKKSSFMMSNDKEGDGADIVEAYPFQLLNSYNSLNNIQKKCLLCFSVFPCDDGNTEALKNLVIKKRMLVYWWAGEGFIHPHQEDIVAKAGAPIPNPSLDPEGNAHSTPTFEEIGNQIFKVLTEKEFIEPVMKKGRETGNCRMHHSVHSFVSAKAKEEGFCDFNPENGKPSLHASRPQRACMLKPDDHFPSSCKLWAKCIGSSTKLECFQNVNTLFNVNEPMVYIKEEWFSKMKNLCVLHLGSWRSENAEHIEVVNQKFLEDLKRMKQLKLLSLKGWSAITRLPDSICKLTNLIILDLRECSYLEELPATIGSLKNLIHLDLTDCRILYKLPKGIRLLSKLEVLKGFVITYVGGALQGKEVCSLRDLQSLGNLRELSLAVNVAKFPDSNDVQVFKEMRNLCKLKISWEINCSFKDKNMCSEGTVGATTHEVLTKSKWQKLKCWEHDGTPRPKHLDFSIEKLELLCYPYETAPVWLDPSELNNLKKLYIVGGKLSKLRGGTNEIEWNVTMLHLKYLRNLDMRWLELRRVFPKMKYLERHHCRKLTLYPCDEEGVWADETERIGANVSYVEEGVWTDESNFGGDENECIGDENYLDDENDSGFIRRRQRIRFTNIYA